MAIAKILKSVFGDRNERVLKLLRPMVAKVSEIEPRYEAMSDEDIRNSLLGIVIGAVPTTSKCVGLVLDHLLDHPDRMAGAQQAARAGDWDLLNGFVDECLRFNPFGPVLLRECRRDHRLDLWTQRGRPRIRNHGCFVAARANGQRIGGGRPFLALS